MIPRSPRASIAVSIKLSASKDRADDERAPVRLQRCFTPRAWKPHFQGEPLPETRPTHAVDGPETLMQIGAEHWSEIVSNEGSGLFPMVDLGRLSTALVDLQSVNLQ
jgi:hypothetical protein